MHTRSLRSLYVPTTHVLATTPKDQTMGNCAGSNLSRPDADVVALCRNRKRLLKATVEHYHALAQAHVSYTLSLDSVATALNLFITAARHQSCLCQTPSDQEGGIHELEEEEEAEKDEGSLVNAAELARERELLDALPDVGEQFIRTSEAGKDLSRMLEASEVLRNSGLAEIKDNSFKLIRAITWSKSSTSLSSSSLYKMSSKKSSFTESGTDVFDNYSGMASGSHSQTLGRMYAWEKKLYDEVKARDDIRHAYQKKCSQLKKQEAKGADSRLVDKNRMIARDLQTRICVALQSIETISKRIEQLRDEELQPQLIELLQGFLKTWKITLESHETQKQIMFEVAPFSCHSQGRLLCCDSQRSVTLQLETELRNWRKCFMSYIEAQREYVEALDGWLSKSYIIPDTEYNSRGRSSFPSQGVGVPPLLAMCHNWINSYRKLPDKTVSYAMKSFIKDMRYLWVQQGEEQQQKRRVDCLAKKLDLRINALQKTENRVPETKLSELKSEPVMQRRAENLAGRKDLIDMLRKKLHKETEKHQDCIRETKRVTINGFKMSLTKVFESLSEFSKDSFKLYDELLMQKQESEGGLNAGVHER